MASMGITVKQTTAHTALVRDSQMIVASSGRLTLREVEGAGRQACKLPIAPEHRSPAWDDTCEPDMIPLMRAA